MDQSNINHRAQKKPVQSRIPLASPMLGRSQHVPRPLPPAGAPGTRTTKSIVPPGCRRANNNEQRTLYSSSASNKTFTKLCPTVATNNDQDISARLQHLDHIEGYLYDVQATFSLSDLNSFPNSKKIMALFAVLCNSLNQPKEHSNHKPVVDLFRLLNDTFGTSLMPKEYFNLQSGPATYHTIPATIFGRIIQAISLLTDTYFRPYRKVFGLDNNTAEAENKCAQGQEKAEVVAEDRDKASQEIMDALVQGRNDEASLMMQTAKIEAAEVSRCIQRQTEALGDQLNATNSEITEINAQIEQAKATVAQQNELIAEKRKVMDQVADMRLGEFARFKEKHCGKGHPVVDHFVEVNEKFWRAVKAHADYYLVVTTFEAELRRARTAFDTWNEQNKQRLQNEARRLMRKGVKAWVRQSRQVMLCR